MKEALPGRRVTRIAKLLLDATWWFLIIIAGLALVLLLLWPVLSKGGSLWSYGVHVSLSDSVARRILPLTSPDTLVAKNPVLRDVGANLRFESPRLSLAFLAGAVALPAFAAILFGLHLGRAFLRDVLAARVFTPTNARRLTLVGWLLIAAGVAWPLTELACTTAILRLERLQGIALGATGGPDGAMVILGILLLVLAAAWRSGVELQRDHDLTV